MFILQIVFVEFPEGGLRFLYVLQKKQAADDFMEVDKKVSAKEEVGRSIRFIPKEIKSTSFYNGRYCLLVRRNLRDGCVFRRVP